MKDRVINYSVKGDGEFLEGFSTLKSARQYVTDLPVLLGIEGLPKKVQILKVVTTTTVMNEYEPKPSVVLHVTKSFDDVDLA